MRRYCEKREGTMFEPYVGLEFDSEAEASVFYNLYSWEVGLGLPETGKIMPCKIQSRSQARYVY